MCFFLIGKSLHMNQPSQTNTSTYQFSTTSYANTSETKITQTFSNSDPLHYTSNYDPLRYTSNIEQKRKMCRKNRLINIETDNK